MQKNLFLLCISIGFIANINASNASSANISIANIDGYDKESDHETILRLIKQHEANIAETISQRDSSIIAIQTKFQNIADVYGDDQDLFKRMNREIEKTCNNYSILIRMKDQSFKASMFANPEINKSLLSELYKKQSQQQLYGRS